jgi:ubiquinone/menaquinone biosynthesis C-methylase UbiE
MWNGYFDEASDCRFGITGRKLRQTPPYTGMTSLGECADNPEVDAITRRFAKAIGYRGILDIGFRFDARDGSYKVLDVNPRLGATFRLFVGADGLDVVRALYLDLTGQPVPPSEPHPGRRWLVEDLDLLSSLRYHRDGVLAARAWLRSFRGLEEGAWFAVDDLLPALAVGGGSVARAGRKLVRSIGLAPARAGEDGERAATEHRAEVTRHFRRAAPEWQRVYEARGLEPLIYRDRHAAALAWVPAPSPEARGLDVGCGAGRAAVALARRGYRVDAIDAAPEMIALANLAARRERVRHFDARVGDAEQLEFADHTFDLVMALGLLPWLHSEARALSEMARVLKPGGLLIASADNAAPLHKLLDPMGTPTLAPLRALVKRLLGRADAPTGLPAAKRHDARALDRLLAGAGLVRVRSASVGFGPFALLGRRLLPERAGVELHHRLQRLADSRWPLLRSTGAHHLVLARKQAPGGRLPSAGAD